jgi:lactoylglutathione lyase
MKITAVNHITINCVDKEASFIFYEKILGLSKIEEIDLGDHVLHYYGLVNGLRLELINYKENQKKLETDNTNLGIYRHMALEVDDLNAFHKACKEAGIKINLEPKYIPEIKRTIMLIADPNGVEIELIQS